MTADELVKEFRETYPLGEFSAFTMAHFVVEVVIPREREAVVDLHLEEQMEQVHKELYRDVRP